MLEIEEVMPMYVCNKARMCNTSPGCGKEIDKCNHTSASMFAENKEAVELFEAFASRFHFVVDDSGRLICTERIKEDG